MSETKKQPKRLSVAESARYLGVSEKVVRNQIKRQRIATFQPSGRGGCHWISVEELDRFQREATGVVEQGA